VQNIYEYYFWQGSEKVKKMPNGKIESQSKSVKNLNSMKKVNIVLEIIFVQRFLLAFVDENVSFSKFTIHFQ